MNEFVRVLKDGLESDEGVRAAWLGGSKATGTEDEHSDIDMVLIAEDDEVERVLEKARALIASLSPIRHYWRAPEPAWHGHSQFFAQPERLKSPFFFIDLVVMRKSHPMKFLETARHGTPAVLFDKDGLVRAEPDGGGPEERRSRQRRRINDIAAFLPFAELLVRKEALRGRELDALGFYQRLLFTPLVELLNIRLRPDRFDFGVRYLKREMPAAEYRDLVDLAFIARPEDLEERVGACGRRIRELLHDLSL